MALFLPAGRIAEMERSDLEPMTGNPGRMGGMPATAA
jgi:hypothetical protein